MDLGIKGRTALVTGGARGIGLEISKTLLNEGCHVIATTRSHKTKEDAQGIFETYRPSAEGIAVVLDVNREDLPSAFAETEAVKDVDFDILVNNAGDSLGIRDPFASMDDWNRILELNTLSPIRLCNLLIPGMQQRGWGRIVNITSCAGLENMGAVTYTVSKAALTAYSRTMGRILATQSPGVVMTAVFPGVILTEGGYWDQVLAERPEHAEKYLQERSPLGRFGKPAEFAPIVAVYCSELASFSHGAIVPVDAGQSRHFFSFNYLDHS